MALRYHTFHGLQIAEGEGDKFKWGNFGRNLSAARNRFFFLWSLSHRKDFLLLSHLHPHDIKYSKLIMKNRSELEGLERDNSWSTASLLLHLLQIQVTNLSTFLNTMLTSTMIMFFMQFLALWHFFLVGQTWVFLACRRIVPFLQSVSKAATHGFTSALNFSVQSSLFYFLESYWFEGYQVFLFSILNREH